MARRAAAQATTGRAAGPNLAKAVAVGEALTRWKWCYPCPPSSWPAAWATVAVELLRQDVEPGHLYDLACHLALASTLPAADSPDAADRAVRALRHHAAAGFDNPGQLTTDRRLVPLAGRPDSQALLHRLQPQTFEGLDGPRDR